MEIEKVLRLLAVLIVIAAFAVKIATKLLFPESDHVADGAIAIVLLLCLSDVVGGKTQEEKKTNQ